MLAVMICPTWILLSLTLRQPAQSGQDVTLSTPASGLELGQFHTWLVELPPGSKPTSIAFDAEMPAHGHGLADQPRIRPAGPRTFYVEGVRFHMTGTWNVRVRYQDSGGLLTVNFPLEVSYSSSQLRSLWLGSQARVRPDPSNRFADSSEAAALGKELFFDKRLSGDGSTSCATCHIPDVAFADTKRFSKLGLTRNTPGLLGVSESPWLLWDGRRDSLWSQALLPIESPEEMGGSRAAVAGLLRGSSYRERYSRLTGLAPESLPVDRVFADAGKWIAAYEQTLQPRASRFDKYVEELQAGKLSKALSADEIAGLNVFLSPEARCTQCHNGPLFTNQGFHNIGTGKFDGEHPDFGRAVGLMSLPYDAFNCRSAFSDNRESCAGLEFAKQDGHDGLLQGAFKVPSLRDVALTAPYMHDGSLATLEAVVEHYRHTPKGGSELRPAVLADEQARQLVAFLRALTGER